MMRKHGRHLVTFLAMFCCSIFPKETVLFMLNMCHKRWNPSRAFEPYRVSANITLEYSRFYDILMPFVVGGM